MWFTPWLAGALAHNPHDPVEDLAVGADGRLWITRVPAANWRLVELATSSDGGHRWSGVGSGLQDPDHLLGVEVRDTSVVAWSAGAVWRSEDGGGSFEAVLELPSGEGVQRVLVTPDGGDVFLGTNARLLHSADGGRTFQVRADAPTAALGASSSFATDRTVYAASAGLVLASTDAGATFTEVARGLPTVQVLAGGPGGELWVGTRAGAWHRDTAGDALAVVPAFGAAEIDLVTPSPAVAVDHTWFVATRDVGLYRTIDGGDTASLSTVNGFLSPQSTRHFFELAFAPGWPAVPGLYLGTFEGLWVSADGGETWAERDTRPPGLVTVVAPSPTFGDDGGVAVGTYDAGAYVSHDRGDTLRVRSTNLVHSSVYALDWVTGPTEPLLLAGMLSHLSVAAADEHLAAWVNLAIDEVEPYLTRVVASPTFATDGTVFVGTRTHGVWRTTDSGASWWNVLPHAQATASVAVSPAFATDGTVLVSSMAGLVWRSVDGGETFSQVALDAPWAFLASTSDPRVVFAGAADGLWVSRDGGATFAPVADAPVGPVHALTWAGADTLYVSTRGGALFRSDDGGATFTALGAAVEGAFEELAASPDHDVDGTLFATAQEGVWRSDDRGVTFERLALEPLRYEESTQAVLLRGGKSLLSDGASARGTVTLRDGDGLSFTFLGRAVRLLGGRRAVGGRGILSVGGVDHPFDTEGKPTDQVRFLEVVLEDLGPHELVIVPEPGASVVVDAFDVFMVPPTPSQDHTGADHTGADHTGAPPTDDVVADDDGGCGCSTSAPTGLAWLVAALLSVRARGR